MGKLIDYHSYPHPLHLNGREQRLIKQERQLREEFEQIKKYSKRIFRQDNKKAAQTE